MFKKLRNKFLLINAAITLVVVVASFAAIYWATYSNTLMVNKTKLEASEKRIEGLRYPLQDALANERYGLGSSLFPISEFIVGQTSQYITTSEIGAIGAITLSASPSFSLEVDESGDMVSVIGSHFEMTDEEFQGAARLAWRQRKNYSVIRYGQKDWMYAIKPIITMSLMAVYDDDVSHIRSFGEEKLSYQIVFLDVTDTNETLLTLRVTFLIIGAAMVFVIIGISYYFAKRAIAPIETAWRKQEQFIADASHELKTPLTIINSNYNVLKDCPDETIGSQAKWLDRIKVGADRMSMLVSGLLTLAKAGDAEAGVEKEVFCYTQALREAIHPMEALMLEKGIGLTVDAAMVTTESDRELVTQLIGILLDNAVKYTDKGGSIHVSLKKYRHHSALSITNTCAGIPDEELPKLFDRFYKGDPSRKAVSNSYGLGLPIARVIAERLGGKLTAESDGHSNAKFIFLL